MMFILDNFNYDRQIIIDNQYYHYHHVCFKLCLLIYFLSDYCKLCL